MQLEIENAPKIQRNSWVGQLIQLTGAKTWCSLIVRVAVVIKLLSLWVLGWYLTFNLNAYFDWTNTMDGFAGFLTFFIGFLFAAATWVATIAVFGLSVYWLIAGVRKFNCWAQNSCTPIFEDEERRTGSGTGGKVNISR